MSVKSSNTALLPGKRIVYDGSCPLCIALRDKMLRWGWIPEPLLADYHQLPQDMQALVDAERFSREMALIDLAGGATIYGAEGIAEIFTAKWPALRGLRRLPGFMPLFTFAYKTLAFNRFVVSTPRKDMPACDCEPQIPALYHLSYLGYSLLVALLVTALFGVAVATYFPTLAGMTGAVAMLLIAGTGWVLQGALALAGMGEKRFQYIRHMFTVMRKGVMPLLPVSLLVLALPQTPYLLPVAAVLLSSLLMLRQHSLRVWQMGRSQGWTLAWFLSLQATAAFWVLYFIHPQSLPGWS